MATDWYAAIQAALDNELTELKTRAETAAKRAAKRFTDHEIEFRKEITRIAAEHFYKDYDPKYYDRKGTLFRILKINRIADDAYEAEFDETLLKYRDGTGGGEGDLYQTVFREGWHGGAKSGTDHPQPGTPYWRAPPKFRNWGRKAYRSKRSPLQEIMEQDERYTAADAAADLRRFWDEEWNAINQ